MTIWLITVNYNQESFIYNLSSCVAYLEFVHLIVTDNSATIDTTKIHCKHTYINPQKNGGYLSGLNRGLKEIDLGNDDIVILCNPDIEFSEGFFCELLNFKFSSDFDLIAPKIISKISGKNQNPNMLKRPSLLHRIVSDIEFGSYVGFLSVGLLKLFAKKALPSKRVLKDSGYIFLPHGSIMIFKSTFFRLKRTFDYDIFLWGEEAVISYEVRLRGGRIFYEPSLIVFHEPHTSTSKVINRNRFEIWKNSYKTYRKTLFL